MNKKEKKSATGKKDDFKFTEKKFKKRIWEKNKQKLWKNLAKSGQVRIINKIPESIGGRKERTMNEWMIFNRWYIECKFIKPLSTNW